MLSRNGLCSIDYLSTLYSLSKVFMVLLNQYVVKRLFNRCAATLCLCASGARCIVHCKVTNFGN